MTGIDQSVRLDHRIALVTGANSGLGKATAIAFARMGATVIMACRSREKGEAALSEVRERSGSQEVVLMLADLSSQASIRALSEEVHRRYDRLHILVNNAGVFNLKRELTVDGIEASIAVNHLAPFLLTHLLLDLLKAGAPARIVNVSSDAHRFASLDPEDLQSERKYAAWKVYGRSKEANIHFTRELARRLEGTGVTANCLHPGGVNTGLGDSNGGIGVPIGRVLKWFFLTPEQGAQTQVWLASSPDVEGISGKYFYKRRERKPTASALDDGKARRLWELSEALTGLR